MARPLHQTADFPVRSLEDRLDPAVREISHPATHAVPQPGATPSAISAASDSDMSKAKDAPLGRPTRYVVVFADKPEHVKVLATITVCSPNPLIPFYIPEMNAC